MKDQMGATYYPNPMLGGDVIPEPACPICLSDQWLEYKEQVVKAISFTHNPRTAEEYWARQRFLYAARDKDVRQIELEQEIRRK